MTWHLPCMAGAYFSSKMIRLVLLLSPGACVMAGAFVLVFGTLGLAVSNLVTEESIARMVDKAKIILRSY